MAKPGDPSGTSGQTAGKGTEAGSGTKPGAGNDGKTAGGGSATGGKSGDAVQVVAKPADIAVLVNKTYKLPDNFKPDDLVEPNIPFIFKEKSEKRLMRKEAAGALEKLVAAAKKDGISLAGVSGYRSQATQKTLFENYVKKDGEEAARKYSAVPGHSEHQTGLAMDVSGSDGKCAASDCFAGTKEAKWLAEHAAEHGFIIRYPKGKEETTGYQYEPWHLRFVGTKIAKDIADKGITLEEYMLNAVPVSK
ncbi:D-alanyl-D-alanine carboxypeptidase family protein [Paenibacillus ginsengarvi]|uniref:D-alanyl-D-alanine carboxypeptidase family protein n=2 Tax=Paenibacillus ginsengarvi TaxID=400777 RepID=A0A3B0CJS9_9BACL|nr:D-alanyl-D-alanine carboxypeptidase family protein [Paenibacillus ginsengarvi]